MGNRGGCFHNADKRLKPTHWKTRQWIICLLDFKGRKRELMAPNQYTELFFLDEATALAAGHRPCFECRRPRAIAFRDALVSSGVFDAKPLVKQLDDVIAGEVQARLKGKLDFRLVSPRSLPDGAMYKVGDQAYLKWQEKALPWSFSGYGAPTELHRDGLLLTPDLTVRAFKHGYVPDVHSSAQSA